MPPKIILEMGIKINNWTVIGEAITKPVTKNTYHLCRCICGKEKEVLCHALRNNKSTSCGCIADKKFAKNLTSHGLSASKTYMVWKSILQRCNNPKAKYYYNYGGRGISICKRWHKFEYFLQDMGLRPKGKEIDRIDNNGNYCKENCRWITHRDNSLNKRNTVTIEYEGKIWNLIDLLYRHKIDRRTFKLRLDRGWSVERALNDKFRTGRIAKTIEFNKQLWTIPKLAKYLKIAPSTLANRLNRGIDLNTAMRMAK